MIDPVSERRALILAIYFVLIYIYIYVIMIKCKLEGY